MEEVGGVTKEDTSSVAMETTSSDKDGPGDKRTSVKSEREEEELVSQERLKEIRRTFSKKGGLLTCPVEVRECAVCVHVTIELCMECGMRNLRI